MKNKRVIIIAAVLVSSFLVYFLLRGSSTSDEASIIVDVERGEFIVEVATTGELQAKNSVKIFGPQGLSKFRIYQITIQKMVEEGTVVKKGDFVASLDPSELNSKVQDAQLEVDQERAEFEQTQLDTTLQMREELDKLINLQYDVEQKKLELEQSQYEPPATIKKNQIALEKAQRALEQAREGLKIKRKQNKAKMREATVKVNQGLRELNSLQDLARDLRISAPESGMVIYTRGWNGVVKEGGQINTWNPVVAELPDLTSMNSVTYVNELDIRRLNVDQFVNISLDAFPDMELTGKVTKVQNVGVQRPNSDAKVFEVIIELDEVDDTMRPGMTTGNTIITNKFEDVLYIPLEALHNFGDSISYVFLSSGINYEQQEVQVGETNANSAIIKLGLEENDRVYLSTPTNETDLEDISLLEELDGKRNLNGNEKIEDGSAEIS